MIIENIKNLILRNKIDNNKIFFAKLINLDSNITMEEAYKIMLKVNPKNTKLIKAKTEKEFLKLITVESCQKTYITVDINYNIIPYKQAKDVLTFIRGEEFATPGNIYRDLDDNVIKEEAKINPKGKFIVIRENTNDEDGTIFYKKEYEVIVYMP